jgi:alpha-L-fucosidase
MKTMNYLFRLVLAAAACGLLAQVQAADATNNPYFIASPADLKARIEKQLHITKPDFVVFVPEVADVGAADTGNEHFLVFDGSDGSLMTVWTQSSVENFSPETPPDQHIVFSQSKDEGKTWAKPRILAGPKRSGDGPMASWAYPLVSKKGRVYILYSQSIGKSDCFVHHTGWLHGIYSDDNGATWSKPQNIPVARSINDNPDPTMPPNMLCWQKPLRLGKDGKYLAGFTRWTSFDVRKPKEKSLGTADSRVEFMRFENVDENPEPRDLKISWFAANEKALAVTCPSFPSNSVCQEPSIVKLPDGRLFCVMRTMVGGPCWSVSSDQGETWTQPRRLLRKDGGEPLLHPVSPCPIYDVGGNEAGSGNYVLFIHNNDGHFKGFKPVPMVTGFNRRPIYIVAGHYHAGADQPVWFDDLQFFMDHDNTSLGKVGTSGRFDLSLYASLTCRNGKPVLWYPERKFFLLGKYLSSYVPAGSHGAEKQQAEDLQLIRAPAAGAKTAAVASERLAWWREAKFGLFIHWGLYSIPAGVWPGKVVKGKYAEHIMLGGKIPLAEYAKLAAEFNPQKFDANAWVGLAKQAGMGYLVFVAKHQDGFAMFDSKVSDFNIVAGTPFKRDPAKELSAAAKAQGMKMGFYYSHARDHQHPLANWNKYGNTWDFPPRTKEDFLRYLNEKAKPQIRELLSRYGDVGVMWFDVPYNIPDEESAQIVELVHTLQPGCLVNSRVGGASWDYRSLGDNQISEAALGEPWETCMTINDTWGYHKLDQHWKPAAQIIRHLADIVSKGGNLLLNIGPKADGTIPEESVRCLEDIGRWMAKNAESIHGASASPIGQPAWGRCTAKDQRLYLHVFDWPVDGSLLVEGLPAKVSRAVLLADGRALPFAAKDRSVTLTLPAKPGDAAHAVIALELVR